MRILLIVIGLITTLTVPALAGDWNFYGSARVATFQVETDAPGKTLDNFNMSLQSNARIGANVRVSDTLSGNFEYGASGGNASLRKLYGEWDFGAGKLLVGQTYTPLNWIYSSQVYGADNNLKAQGFIYSGREPMIRLTFGTFQVALVEPDTNDLGTGFASEVTFPAVEAGYSHKFEFITLEAAAGYQSYALVDAGTTHDIDSYVFALGARLKMGAAFLNTAAFTGKNAGNLIALSVDGDNRWDDGFAVISGNRVLENDCRGYALAAGYKLSNRFTFEAGYGYNRTGLDTAADDDTSQTYYTNVTVTLTPGVFFVPEIGRFDGRETGDSKTTYYGIKWQINF